MPVIVRPVAPGDRDAWEPLWEGYQHFYEVAIPPEVTALTWARFLDEGEPVHALVAETDGRLVGLVHYIFHRNTWMAGPVCYLQDLFTDPATRGQGIGRALIEAVYGRAAAAACSRVYWLTHETNAQAMALYDGIAKRSGFVQYRKDLG